jgi:hypothetical protein
MVGVGVLLALLLSALFIEGIPVVHAHADDEPAIYNAECTFAVLAAHTAGAPLPSAHSSSTPLTPGRTPDLALAQALSCPFLSSAEPRAPPTN